MHEILLATHDFILYTYTHTHPYPLYSYFQSQGKLATKIGPAGPFLFSQEWSDWPDCFYPDHFSVTASPAS